ncbi:MULTISPECIES: sporulation integral membrane protein YlbJ [Clostridium]|uniref:sporulation integral membrane protein YlbJ n=1 Tax=Clostridium TaxID=1485 RepID=UPI0008253FF5|nr:MULTISPECIES: sporulation integral membrane protein YlbJ [Clostridium]PJI06627.1 sporulation integral membrane protein YlbJ [Clostridium sp. CT7]
MLILFLLIICSIIILLFLFIKNLHLNNVSNYIITFSLSLVILFIILKPEVCITSAISGAKLFFYSVFPYVFPFLIITNLIISYDGIEIYSKLLGPILCKPQKLPKESAIVLIISALCGYPLGAKYSADLYENKVIDFSTFERLINIASNAGPLFIVGAIGTSMLKNKHLGYILLISCYLSCIVMGIILPYKKSTNYVTQKIKKNVFKKHSFGITLKQSAENAIKVTLQIMSFIIIFSVLIGILKQSAIFKSSETNLFKTVILGLIEMTNGTSIISSSNFEIEIKMITISFLISFGGLCVISQIYSFIGKYKISYFKFMLRKILQGIMSSIICFIIMKFSYIDTNTAAVFNINKNFTNYYYIFALLIFLLPIIVNKLKKII